MLIRSLVIILLLTGLSGCASNQSGSMNTLDYNAHFALKNSPDNISAAILKVDRQIEIANRLRLSNGHTTVIEIHAYNEENSPLKIHGINKYLLLSVNQLIGNYYCIYDTQQLVTAQKSIYSIDSLDISSLRSGNKENRNLCNRFLGTFASKIS